MAPPPRLDPGTEFPGVERHTGISQNPLCRIVKRRSAEVSAGLPSRWLFGSQHSRRPLVQAEVCGEEIGGFSNLLCVIRTLDRSCRSFS